MMGTKLLGMSEFSARGTTAARAVGLDMPWGGDVTKRALVVWAICAKMSPLVAREASS